jgi:hypothetical protein
MIQAGKECGKFSHPFSRTHLPKMNNPTYDYSVPNAAIEAHPSRILRFFARFFSIFFHPLFISAYVLAFLMYLHPAAFEGIDPRTKNLRMFSILLFTLFFPALSLFLAWRLKLIKNLVLENRQDRLVGFIVTMFFYFWASYVFRNLPDTPSVAAHFVLGTFLAVCGAWMCTIFYKVSLHAVAMGGLVSFFILFGNVDPFVSGLYLAVPVLIAGIVCSSRFILGAHNRFEMVTGFFVGLLAQSLAWLF